MTGDKIGTPITALKTHFRPVFYCLLNANMALEIKLNKVLYGKIYKIRAVLYLYRIGVGVFFSFTPLFSWDSLVFSFVWFGYIIKTNSPVYDIWQYKFVLFYKVCLKHIMYYSYLLWMLWIYSFFVFQWTWELNNKSNTRWRRLLYKFERIRIAWRMKPVQNFFLHF